MYKTKTNRCQFAVTENVQWHPKVQCFVLCCFEFATAFNCEKNILLTKSNSNK